MTRMEQIFESFFHLDDKDDGIVSQLMFFLPLGVLIFSRFLLSYSAFPTIVGKAITYADIRLICVGCLVARELLFGKWDRLTLLGLFVFGWLGAMAFIANYKIAFDTIAFVFFGRNIRFKRIVVFMLLCQATVASFIMIAAAIGAIPDTILMRGTEIRHQLGFSHANTFPGTFLFMTCAWIFMRDKKYGVADAIVILVIVAVLFYLTKSRTSCSTTASIALLALIIKWMPGRVLRSRFLSFLGISSVALCAILAIALCMFYDPSIGWMEKLNSAISGRLSLGHAAIVNHGIPLIGQKVDSGMTQSYSVTTGTWVANRRTTATIIDCEYVRFLVACGWPFMLIAIILCTIVCYRARRKEQWLLLAIIAIIAIHGISENYGPLVFFDPFIFLLGELFSHDNFLSMPEASIADYSRETFIKRRGYSLRIGKTPAHLKPHTRSRFDIRSKPPAHRR